MDEFKPLDVAELEAFVDGKVLAGLARLQAKIDGDLTKSSNAMVSNYVNRPPLLTSDELSEIVEFADPMKLELVNYEMQLGLIDASLARVRRNGKYRASLLFDKRTHAPLIMLNNGW